MKRTFWTFFHIVLIFEGVLCLAALGIGRPVLRELFSLLIVLAALGFGFFLSRRPRLADEDPQAFSFRRRAAMVGIIVAAAVTALNIAADTLGLDLRVSQFIDSLPLTIAGWSIIWDLIVYVGMDEAFSLNGRGD